MDSRWRGSAAVRAAILCLLAWRVPFDQCQTRFVADFGQMMDFAGRMLQEESRRLFLFCASNTRDQFIKASPGVLLLQVVCQFGDDALLDKVTKYSAHQAGFRAGHTHGATRMHSDTLEGGCDPAIFHGLVGFCSMTERGPIE